jgi:hypothetical protein
VHHRRADFPTSAFPPDVLAVLDAADH